jgi:hypothetical protein
MSTTTVSVRDGWLTHSWDEGDRRLCEAVRLSEVRHFTDARNPITGKWATVLFAPNAGLEIEGVRAAEVMELIHAGKGEIRREVP